MDFIIEGTYLGRSEEDDNDLFFRLPDDRTVDLVGLMMLLSKELRYKIGVLPPGVPFRITASADLPPLEHTEVPTWQSTFLTAIRNRRTVLTALREAGVGQRVLRDAIANDLAFVVAFEAAQAVARTPKRARTMPEQRVKQTPPADDTGRNKWQRADAPTWVEPFLAALREGLSIQQAARRVGVSKQTTYERRKRHADFAAAVSDALVAGKTARRAVQQDIHEGPTDRLAPTAKNKKQSRPQRTTEAQGTPVLTPGQIRWVNTAAEPAPGPPREDWRELLLRTLREGQSEMTARAIAGVSARFIKAQRDQDPTLVEEMRQAKVLAKNDWKRVFLAVLRSGRSAAEAADVAGIFLSVVQEAKDQDPEFAAAWAAAVPER